MGKRYAPEETWPEDEQPDQFPEGAAARRNLLVGTGALGTGGALVGLLTHGPSGLFVGALLTAGLLAIEQHGEPADYAWIEKYLSPGVRVLLKRARARSRLEEPDDEAEPVDEELEPPAPATRREQPRVEPGSAVPQGGKRPQLAPPTIQMHSPRVRPPAAQAAFTFSDVLWKGFQPTLDRLYLATLEDGTDVYVPADKLCHVALAGATRGGKGHIKRSLMAQLCAAGAEVYLLDPNYTQWDRESVDPSGQPCPEDWTPYTPYLQNDPLEMVPVSQKYQVIEHYLKELKRELDRRMERYGYSRPVGRPLYVFIDEMPAIVDNLPAAPGYLKALLREGAKVGVYVVTLAQDFLTKTLFPNEGGAIRDCYRTVLYVGGDATTARILLDMPATKVPEHELGKGRVMLRCDLVRPAALARVPYVDNPALYALLGPSTYVELDEDEEDDQPWEPERSPYLRPVTPAHHPQEQEHAPTTAPRSSCTSGPRVLKSAAIRKREREQRLRPIRIGRPREQPGPAAPHSTSPTSPESDFTREEIRVLEAYRAGLKTGNAIASETGLSSTRVNQALNKLARRNVIDWQPRKG